MGRGRKIRKRLGHRDAHHVKERARVQTHDERQGNKRQHDEQFASAHVLHGGVLLVGDFAEDHALVHPQHVGGAEHHAAGGDGAEHLIEAEAAEQNEELADKAVEARQADRRQHDDQEADRVDRQHFPEPAVLGDQARVSALVDHANQKEERPGRDAVVEHLVDRAFHALGAQRGDTEHHKTKVADRGVGHQFLHVGLHHGDQRAVDDADDG